MPSTAQLLVKPSHRDLTDAECYHLVQQRYFEGVLKLSKAEIRKRGEEIWLGAYGPLPGDYAAPPPAPDPRALGFESCIIRRFGQFFRPSPDYRKPRPHVHEWAPQPQSSTFEFVVSSGGGERTLTGTIDQHLDALVHANRAGQSVLGRFDAEQDGIVLAEFASEPISRCSGRTAPALPLVPSIATRVQASDKLMQMIWLCTGSLTEELHDGIAERLGNFSALHVVTKGTVDLWWGGFYCWTVPHAPYRVSAMGNAGCGEAATRYGVEDLDSAFCHALRQPIRDENWC